MIINICTRTWWARYRLRRLWKLTNSVSTSDSFLWAWEGELLGRGNSGEATETNEGNGSGVMVIHMRSITFGGGEVCSAVLKQQRFSRAESNGSVRLSQMRHHAKKRVIYTAQLHAEYFGACGRHARFEHVTFKTIVRPPGAAVSFDLCHIGSCLRYTRTHSSKIPYHTSRASP